MAFPTCAMHVPNILGIVTLFNLTNSLPGNCNLVLQFHWFKSAKISTKKSPLNWVNFFYIPTGNPWGLRIKNIPYYIFSKTRSFLRKQRFQNVTQILRFYQPTLPINNFMTFIKKILLSLVIHLHKGVPPWVWNSGQQRENEISVIVYMFLFSIFVLWKL